MATSSTIVTPEPGQFPLVARLDELERMFSELISIVQGIIETQTEFTGRTTRGAR